MDKPSKKVLSNGRVRHTLVTDPNDVILIIKPDRYYRLGGQHDDIVGSHILEETVVTYWCSITQKWI